MKLAAAKALAALAREEVPDSVSRAYGGQKFSLGRNTSFLNLRYARPLMGSARRGQGCDGFRRSSKSYS